MKICRNKIKFPYSLVLLPLFFLFLLLSPTQSKAANLIEQTDYSSNGSISTTVRGAYQYLGNNIEGTINQIKVRASSGGANIAVVIYCYSAFTNGNTNTLTDCIEGSGDGGTFATEALAISTPGTPELLTFTKDNSNNDLNFTFISGVHYSIKIQPNNTTQTCYVSGSSSSGSYSNGYAYRLNSSYIQDTISGINDLYFEFQEAAQGCAPGYILIGESCVLNNDATKQGLLYFTNPYLCSNQSTCKINYLYDQNTFSPYDYISIYQYESPTSTTRNLIATSTIIDYSMFNKNNGSSYFLLTGTSTVSGLHYYDIEATLAESWNPETATTTPATTTIPYMVIVDWSTYVVTDLNTWITEQINSTTTANNDLDINTYELACTAEQWASDSWWTESLCQIKKSILDFGVSAGEIAKKVAFSVTAYIKGMFPFNVIINVKNSWDNSENAALSSEFAWVSQQIAQDGTVYFNMPKFEGMATNTVIIYGENLGDSEWTEYQAMVRSLSTLVLIGFFFWFSIIKRAERIYHKLKDEI